MNRPKQRGKDRGVDLHGFCYGDPEEEKQARRALEGTSLPATRGDLFVWAYLCSETMSIVARSNEDKRKETAAVVSRGIYGDSDDRRAIRAEEDAWRAREQAYHPIQMAMPKAQTMILSVTLGEWPDTRDMSIEFCLSEQQGVVARCNGWTGKAPVIPGLDRQPSNEEGARRIAKECVLAAMRLLVPFQNALTA